MESRTRQPSLVASMTSERHAVILRMYREGYPCAEIAERAGISRVSVHKVVKRAKEDGRLPPDRRGVVRWTHEMDAALRSACHAGMGARVTADWIGVSFPVCWNRRRELGLPKGSIGANRVHRKWIAAEAELREACRG